MIRLTEFAGVSAAAMIAVGGVIGFQHVPQSTRNQIASLISRSDRSLFQAAPAQTGPVRVATAGPEVLPATPPVAPPPRIASPAPALRATPTPPPNQTAPPPQIDNAATHADDVADRIRQSVPSELFQFFDVYLYVSKAASGEWAQRMFVYHKDGQRLVFEEAFPVSTGRERQEKYFTTTPAGLFELDPHRFDANHRSHRWHNAPMPWAMFLDYEIKDHPVGIALHSAIGHEADLGHRASGGCVRMPHAKAEEYFKRFRATEAGQVPIMAFDDLSGTTRADGAIERDAENRPVVKQGYKVLLIIQNYPGGPAFVAAVS